MIEYRIPLLNYSPWQEPVKDKDLTVPPVTPAKGDQYIVGAEATGDWTGEDDNIALWTGTEWTFVDVKRGFFCFVEDEDCLYTFTTEWILFTDIFELDPVFTAWLATDPLASFLTEETDPLSLHLDQTEPQTIINGVPLMTTAVDEYGSCNQLVNMCYVRGATWLFPPIIEWYDPVEEEGLPEDPEVGDRYGADSTGYGWTIDYIYEWDGDEWVESEPEEGWMLWCLLDLLFYVFFSGGWMIDGAYTYVPYTGALYDVDLGTKNFLTTGTLGAGAITGTSLTDGTLSITGGDLSTSGQGTFLSGLAIGQTYSSDGRIYHLYNPTAAASVAYQLISDSKWGSAIMPINPGIRGINFIAGWQPADGAVANRTVGILEGGIGLVRINTTDITNARDYTATDASGLKTGATLQRGASHTGNVTMTNLYMFNADTPSIGAGCSVGTLYAFYDAGMSGATASWGFYGLSLNNAIAIDNGKWLFGEGLDASIYFDGSDLIVNSEDVTANDEVHFTNFSFYQFDNPLKITTIKSGATQAAAGAAANEVWKTNGHATLPDNVLMIGI